MKPLHGADTARGREIPRWSAETRGSMKISAVSCGFWRPALAIAEGHDELLRKKGETMETACLWMLQLLVTAAVTLDGMQRQTTIGRDRQGLHQTEF